VTEVTAFLSAQLAEGNPFYVSSILCSQFPDKDLTTLEGLVRTLEFETLNDNGEIKSTWMTYVNSAFNQVNNKISKNIVLYLCKNRDHEVTRKELLEKLHLDMTDGELEFKLKALIKADIILQGATNYDYHGKWKTSFVKKVSPIRKMNAGWSFKGFLTTDYTDSNDFPD